MSQDQPGHSTMHDRSICVKVTRGQGTLSDRHVCLSHPKSWDKVTTSEDLVLIQGDVTLTKTVSESANIFILSINNQTDNADFSRE